MQVPLHIQMPILEKAVVQYIWTMFSALVQNTMWRNVRLLPTQDKLPTLRMLESNVNQVNTHYYIILSTTFTWSRSFHLMSLKGFWLQRLLGFVYIYIYNIIHTFLRFALINLSWIEHIVHELENIQGFIWDYWVRGEAQINIGRGLDSPRN